MALLDLQGMERQSRDHSGHSGASKGCGNDSTLSLLIC